MAREFVVLDTDTELFRLGLEAYEAEVARRVLPMTPTSDPMYGRIRELAHLASARRAALAEAALWQGPGAGLSPRLRGNILMHESLELFHGE